MNSGEHGFVDDALCFVGVVNGLLRRHVSRVQYKSRRFTIMRIFTTIHMCLLEHAHFDAEIAAHIAKHCFKYLDAPVIRCGSLDTAHSHEKALEDQFLAKARLEETMEKAVKLLNLGCFVRDS